MPSNRRWPPSIWDTHGFFRETFLQIHLHLHQHLIRRNRIHEVLICQNQFARRKLVEDQDTILELTGKIQKLQNEINCMTDSKDFQDAESVRSGNSHVTSRPVSFPPHPIPEGMQSRSFGMRAAEGGRQAFGTHMVYRETFFANPYASSSAPYPQELNPWSSHMSEPIHSSPADKNENRTQFKIRDASPDRQPKIQSSSVEETLQRIMGQTNNDCRFLIFTLTSSLHQQPSLAGR